MLVGSRLPGRRQVHHPIGGAQGASSQYGPGQGLVLLLHRELEGLLGLRGALLHELARDLGMVALHRPGQRAGLVEGVVEVGVGPAGQEQLDHGQLSLVGGEEERRRVVASLRVHVEACVE